jgi:enamine deaminase RidA (YjgF/YER057c/UK114 family)
MPDEVVSMRRINPPELGAPPGYSNVVEVRADRLIFIAGQTASAETESWLAELILLRRPNKCSEI